jgi:hydrogenase 3 maturation protease
MIDHLYTILGTHQRILFVGIGNVLKSDDGVGVYICERLEESWQASKLRVEVSIENYIGKINALNPDILILIDAVDFGQDPGYCHMLPVMELQGFTTNTHNISLDQLSVLFHAPSWIIGVQPLHVGFGESLSDRVKKAADVLVQTINSALTHIHQPVTDAIEQSLF